MGINSMCWATFNVDVQKKGNFAIRLQGMKWTCYVRHEKLRLAFGHYRGVVPADTCVAQGTDVYDTAHACTHALVRTHTHALSHPRPNTDLMPMPMPMTISDPDPTLIPDTDPNPKLPHERTAQRHHRVIRPWSLYVPNTFQRDPPPHTHTPTHTPFLSSSSSPGK